VKLEAECKSPFDITKYGLDQCEMRFGKIMHVEVDLLNDIGNVETHQSEVLENVGKVVIHRRINNR
jgi:hypothetical protein